MTQKGKILFYLESLNLSPDTLIHLPWIGSNHRPVNLITRRPYNGLNSMLLNAYALYYKFQSNLWLTKHQVEQCGARIPLEFREKPACIYLLFPSSKSGYGFRQLELFNAHQLENLHLPSLIHPTPKYNPEDFLQKYDNWPQIQFIKDSTPAYHPDFDLITIPTGLCNMELYNALFHELIHATGHLSRLARFNHSYPVRYSEYIKEELIAEMGASLLFAYCETPSSSREVNQYIRTWHNELEEKDFTLLICAAKAASAVNHLIYHMENSKKASRNPPDNNVKERLPAFYDEGAW